MVLSRIPNFHDREQGLRYITEMEQPINNLKKNKIMHCLLNEIEFLLRYNSLPCGAECFTGCREEDTYSWP